MSRQRAVALVAILVLVVGVVAVGAHLRAGRSRDAVVDGYPQRIGFQRPAPKLPDRPGPLAATLYDNDFGSGHHLAVSSTGRLWTLPYYGTLELSPDGGQLLTQQGFGRFRLLVRDLSTGERRVFPDIAGGDIYSVGARKTFGPTKPHFHLQSYSSVFWSPDRSSILASIGRRGNATHGHPRVLDLDSGTLTAIGAGRPAGFRSSSQAVTVLEPDEDGRIVAVTTDLRTSATRTLALRLTSPWRGDPHAEPIATVSPDGGTIALVERPSQRNGSEVTVRLFSLADGREDAPRRGVDGTDVTCAPTWIGGDPVLPTETVTPRGKFAGAVRVAADGSHPLVAVHYRMQSSCLQLASSALAGGPHRALFGTSTNWLTWYWKPALIVGACLLGLLVLRVRARLLRRRHRV